MDRTLENFITALRRCGVRISVAETIDALQAVALSGYDRPAAVRRFSVCLSRQVTAGEKDI